MYSNLLKAGWVVCKEEEKVVIDNNERMAKLLEELHAEKNNGAQDAPAISGSEMKKDFDLSGPEAALFADADGSFQSGLDAESVEVEEPVIEGPTPEELREQAEQDAEEIRAAARAEAEQLKNSAYEEGKNQGYDAGYQEGLLKIQEMEAALAEKETFLEKQYQDKMAELEPRFVETLNGIYERVFDVKFSEQKGLILHLLTSAMREIDETKDFMLHVSPEDYKEVRAAKAMLTSESLVGNATVEIIEDMTLSKNECLIETGGGIFDCSLGTELEQLKKELKLLSYEK